MLKRISYVLLGALCIAVFCVVPVQAFSVLPAQQTQNILNVNGLYVPLQEPVLTKEDIIYLPWVETCSRLGGRVGWNSVTREVTANCLDLHIVLQANSKEVSLGESLVVLPQAPFILAGRTYVPLSFLEELGLMTNVEQDERNKINYVNLYTAQHAFKFGTGELFKAKLKAGETPSAYLLHYPTGISVIRMGEEEALYQELLAWEQDTVVEEETLLAYPGYNSVVGVCYEQEQVVLQVALGEVRDVVTRPVQRPVLRGHLHTRNGVYALSEECNKFKELTFTAEGQLSRSADAKKTSFSLQKRQNVLPAMEIGAEPGFLQQYLVVDADRLFIFNAGGFLTEEKHLRERIEQPYSLALEKKDAYLVVGSVRSPDGKYQKIYGEVFNLDSRQVHSSSFVFTKRDASALQVRQVFVVGEKIILQVSDGQQRYLGYYDLVTSEQDLQPLPHWVTDVEVIQSSEGEFVLCRDGVNLYVQKLAFGVEEE